jgi:phosphatidate phosphatase APP1
MTNWRHMFSQLANAGAGGLGSLKRWADARWGDEPICIVAYRSYGTRDLLYLKGRVLEERRIRPASPTDSAWRNMANMYRRFESDEIAGARVLAHYGAAEHEAVTDREGFFEVRIAPVAPLPADQLWHAVELALLEPRHPAQAEVRATGAVLVPPPSAQFGVISDIDDTVLRTDATSLVRMFRTTFLGNAHTRLPFPGVAALYRALQRGTSAQIANPLFYVSSSPWNIYDMLEEFFEVQQIPAGPLMLRDWGLTSKEASPFRHRQHKIATIRRILDTYPALPFLLIGDSGQQDPEIYREVVRTYPNRILAIYIRNVSRKPARIAAIQALAEEVAQAGSALVLADDSLAAARHAAAQGWVAPAALAEVEAASAAGQTTQAARQPAVLVHKPPAAAGHTVARVLATSDSPKPPTVVVEGNTRDR